jgi:restriction endonuclease Mrr
MNNFSRLGVEQLEAREVPTVTSFVTNLYQEVLGRQPDTGGYDSWVNQLNAGTKNTGDVAISFITSTEYRNNTIIGYYQAQLGRTPTAAEIQPFLNRLVAGESQDAVRLTFFGSEEFFNKAGRNNAQFVKNLYDGIFDRLPTNAEINYWVSVLNQTNGDRTFVAQQFLYGREYQQYQAAYAYVNLLERQPDLFGLLYWTDRRASGMTIETMDVSFLASVEYFNKP